uniref:VHS domain-containing protein n=1 Tax=Rhizochromulina marina TaxID=1034831 RepID=A0A7S2W1F0_9STRA|mmetsp:Transcript_11546/g.33341  ORF Transcript_11546/g.33341 Transcript_11546/m.33341 type:complete len:508 (+) Transcript_11546:145-1668(+)
MDFFRFDSNSPTNDGSPVAQAIERATDPMLLTTDWGKNLEICDMINTGGQAAVTSATRMLRRQLRSDQPKTVMLALELTDACVKNCAFELHRAVASKAFMGDVVALAEGKKGFEPQELSLKLIQEWGKEFKATRSELPGFFDTYVGLKTKGAAFPESESSAPVFSPPPQITAEEPPQTGHASASAPAAASSGPGPSALPGASPGQPAPSPTGGPGEASMDKLRQDLVAVEEKIKLCREMLPESPGIEHDEALSEVVGFLEACQPRLSDLIEAGMQDILSEDILSYTLHVFDELQKTLEAERTGTPIPPTSPAPAPASASPEDVVAAAASGAAAASAALDLMGAEDEEPSLRTGRRKGRKAAAAAAAAALEGVAIQTDAVVARAQFGDVQAREKSQLSAMAASFPYVGPEEQSFSLILDNLPTSSAAFAFLNEFVLCAVVFNQLQVSCHPSTTPVNFDRSAGTCKITLPEAVRFKVDAELRNCGYKLTIFDRKSNMMWFVDASISMRL